MLQHIFKIQQQEVLWPLARGEHIGVVLGVDLELIFGSFDMERAAPCWTMILDLLARATPPRFLEPRNLAELIRHGLLLQSWIFCIRFQCHRHFNFARCKVSSHLFVRLWLSISLTQPAQQNTTHCKSRCTRWYTWTNSELKDNILTELLFWKSKCSIFHRSWCSSIGWNPSTLFSIELW